MIGITGATGFVGKNLSLYLQKQGETVKAITREELYKPLVGLDGLSSIVHLAGKAHDLKKVSDPSEYYQVNLELTRKIYDEFLNSDANTFIYVSSVKAVADSCAVDLTENIEPSPQTDYGKSKLLAEEYIQSQMLKPGKRYLILRPCMIHGPGNKGNLNLLYQFISKGIPYPLASYDNKRSFLSVENLCFIIHQLLKSDVGNDVYNIADSGVLSTKKVVQLIANGISVRPRLLNIPKFIINGLAKIGDVFKLPINSERLVKLTENFVVDNSKIVKALNMQLPLNIEEGITITAKSFNDEINDLK